MKLKIPALLILLIGILFSSYSQERYIARIYCKDKGLQLQEMQKNDLEIIRVEDTFLDVLVTEDQYKMLQNAHFAPVIRTTQKQLQSNLTSGRKLEAYLTYDEIYELLASYATDYPEICTLHDIGNSLGKDYYEQGYTAYENYQHDIWALKISDNPEIEEDEPSLLFDGAHHARELIGPAVILNFVEHLLTNYGSDPNVTTGVDNNQIWIVPVVNPDGYKLVTDSTEIWWRKTIRDNNENHAIDPFIPDWIEPDGVDPNRNYGNYWGGDWITVPSFRETYAGPYSFSENCTAALANLMQSHHFVTELSYHSYGEVFLYPWGYSSPDCNTPDYLLYNALGSELASMTAKLTYGKYTARCAGSLICITGGTIDYAYGQHGIIAFCVELAQDFIPEPEDIIPVCNANLPAQMFLLKRVHNSMLTGKITDATTGDPLEATIFIEGIDNDPGGREDYKSDDEFGSYYRLLLPGQYTVIIEKFGYEARTFNNIDINETTKTVLDVGLQPAAPFTYSGMVVNQSLTPIPNARINIKNVLPAAILSDDDGFFEMENFYEGTYDVVVSADHYYTHYQTMNIDNLNSSSTFELEEFEWIDFEEEDQLNHFEMGGYFDWSRTDEEHFNGEYSMVSHMVYSTQYTSATISLTFDTDILMGVATKVSLDSVAQGMVFIMDEQKMKSYTWEQDWSVDTFYISNGTHDFKWSVSGSFSNPGPSYQNKCWLDDIRFINLTTAVPPINDSQTAVFSCYPNPSSNEFIISFAPEVGRIYHVGVYDLSGKLINMLLSSATDPCEIRWDATNGAGLPVSNGVYLLKAVTDKGIHSEKLVKQ